MADLKSRHADVGAQSDETGRLDQDDAKGQHDGEEDEVHLAVSLCHDTRAIARSGKRKIGA